MCVLGVCVCWTSPENEDGNIAVWGLDGDKLFEEEK